MPKSLKRQLAGFFRDACEDFEWCGDSVISDLLEPHEWVGEVEPAIVDLLGMEDGSCIGFDVETVTLDDILSFVEDRLGF